MVKSEVGVLADITGALAGAGVNVHSINAEETGETGLVILSTDDNDAALQALTAAGFRAVVDDALVIRLPDSPGALSGVAENSRTRA